MRRFAPLTVAFALVLLPAACGGDDSGGPPPGSTAGDNDQTGNNDDQASNNDDQDGNNDQAGNNDAASNNDAPDCEEGDFVCLDEVRYQRCEDGVWFTGGCGSFVCQGGECRPPDQVDNNDTPNNDTPPQCLPEGDCRFDHSCALRADGDAAPVCLADGTCGAGPDCPDGPGVCECGQDNECIAGQHCEGGACVDSACRGDCECGPYQECAGGTCSSCLATCVSDVDCISNDRCERYGHNMICTRCVRQ